MIQSQKKIIRTRPPSTGDGLVGMNDKKEKEETVTMSDDGLGSVTLLLRKRESDRHHVW